MVPTFPLFLFLYAAPCADARQGASADRLSCGETVVIGLIATKSELVEWLLLAVNALLPRQLWVEMGHPRMTACDPKLPLHRVAISRTASVNPFSLVPPANQTPRETLRRDRNPCG